MLNRELTDPGERAPDVKTRFETVIFNDVRRDDAARHAQAIRHRRDQIHLLSGLENWGKKSKSFFALFYLLPYSITILLLPAAEGQKTQVLLELLLFLLDFSFELCLINSHHRATVLFTSIVSVLSFNRKNMLCFGFEPRAQSDSFSYSGHVLHNFLSSQNHLIIFLRRIKFENVAPTYLITDLEKHFICRFVC